MVCPWIRSVINAFKSKESLENTPFCTGDCIYGVKVEEKERKR